MSYSHLDNPELSESTGSFRGTSEDSTAAYPVAPAMSAPAVSAPAASPTAGPAWLRASLQVQGLALAGAALAGLLLAEILVAWVDRTLGAGLYALLFAGLLGFAGLAEDDRIRRLSLSLSLVAFICVLAFAMPLSRLPALVAHAVIILPLLLATVAVLRRFDLPLTLVGLGPGQGSGVLVWYPVAALTGVILGFAEAGLLHPQSLFVVQLGKGVPPLWLALAAALLALGALLEETIFRGLLLHSLSALFGDGTALLYSAMLGAFLQLGYGALGSMTVAAQVTTALLAGLWFGWLTLRTRSIYPAALAHALSAVTAYLFIAGGLLR